MVGTIPATRARAKGRFPVVAKEARGLSQKEALQLLDYDPSTGTLRWRTRTPEMFPASGARTPSQACLLWNAQFAGREAGSIQNNGYIVVRIWRKLYLAHRLAWLMVHGEWVPEIDHKDRCPANNKIENLRNSSRSNNCHNTKDRDNASGFAGVSKLSGQRDRPWQASISLNKRRVCLGNFATAEDAAMAYREAKAAHLARIGS